MALDGEKHRPSRPAEFQDEIKNEKMVGLFRCTPDGDLAAGNFCRKCSGNFPKLWVESFKGLENELLRLTVRKRRGLFADARTHRKA